MACSHRRPGRPSAPADAAGGRYLVWEYLVRCWRRYLLSSLAEAVGTPLLYLLALGVGLGSLIDSGPDPDALGGISYLDYIAPALLVAAAVQVAVGESSYPAYSRFKWSRVFWGVTATPVTPAQVCEGEVLFIATRMAAGSTLYYLVLLAFGAAGGADRGADDPDRDAHRAGLRRCGCSRSAPGCGPRAARSTWCSGSSSSR